MSDKSFGDNANRNIVKNPLLSTAVTGLSFEDLTHNAVLFPVASNQEVITGSDESGNYTHTLAHTDNEHTKILSGDTNLNIQQYVSQTQPSIPPYSNLDNQSGYQYDTKQEKPMSTVSKASEKSEDDFDVNEYFARLQGTRYVSAPIHSHPDQNANLAATEDSLEEINLNDEKNVEVQQSLTADIAQNFSQLPNVLPHVASAVFSSFSNMWSMKSREPTPDNKSYQDVQFQVNQNINQNQQAGYQDVPFQGVSPSGLGHYQTQILGMSAPNVPIMDNEDVVKEVAPPPKEPPVCGTSNFRLSTKKKYAQIPGLSTKVSQTSVFDPMTQNVPPYFIPSEEPNKNIEQNTNIFQQKHFNVHLELNQQTNTKPPNVLNVIDDTALDRKTNIFVPTENQSKVPEDIHSSINLQNQMSVIPPPPMFSSQRRNSQTGKAVLPPSVARRIGSNNPVMKQQIIQPSVPGHIFVPNFDSNQNLESQLPESNPDISACNLPKRTTNINESITPSFQETSSMPSQSEINQSNSSFGNKHILNPIHSNAPFMLTHEMQISTPEKIMPGRDTSLPPISSTNLSNTGSTSIPLFSPPSSISALSSGPILPPGSSEIFVPAPTTINPPAMFNPCATQESIPEPPTPLSKPPKPTSSNFRMTKKKPQYYSGPIEGIGSISNSIKPVIPTVESNTFQGALFTPEQSQLEPIVSSFDINKEIDTANTYTPFGTTPLAMSSESHYWSPSNPISETVTPPQDYNQQYNTVFDLSRPSTANYEDKDEPKEYKGIGIIGSLKSKLSNLDINKIQNSVTTFFDPAYNVTKKDSADIQENVSNDPTQYQSQGNFEIFVPNVVENQPYNYSYQANQYAYNQSCQDYSHPYVPKHDSSFVDNRVIYPPKTNVHAEQSHTLNQPPMCTIYSNENSSRNVVALEENLTQFHDKDMKNNAYKSNPVTEGEYSYSIPFAETPLEKNNFKEESGVLHDVKNKREDYLSKTEMIDTLPDNLFQHKLKPTSQVIKEGPNIKTGITPRHEKDLFGNIADSYPIPSASLSTDTKTLFEMSSNLVSSPTTLSETNTCTMPAQYIAYHEISDSFSNVSLDDNKQYHDISNYKYHDIVRTDKQEKPLEVLPQSSQEGKVQQDNLLESLTKGDVPLLAVSSMPLFGLSTIIADKAKEGSDSKGDVGLPLYERVKNKDILDTKAGTSFFENIASPIEKDENREESYNIGSLDKNVGFFQKDRINIDKLDAQITSSRLFSSNQMRDVFDTKSILDKKVSLYDNFGAAARTEDFALNKDVILDSNENNADGKSGISEDTQNVSELNICETCREVNKPEDRETEVEDLTTQLIENLTSPIQLSNAVEVPLAEDNKTKRVDFDAGQFTEICHITEDTIENIHVQSATELLDDNDIKMRYGWTTDNKYDTDLMTHHNYGYNMQHIGLFGEPLFGDNVPANASDELKAEFKHQEDLIPKQMCTPTAPPAEDLKSDEACVLDVQSIELDAKQDFPIYEEFVIEPSETDDDKMECKEREKTEESDLDSFTNRVEKFKKMEEVFDLDDTRNVQKCIDLPAQPISMASYFDTGNYAAETHYRNTIHSPNIVSIPPGFEEEFKKRLTLAKAAKDAMVVVPNTSTQTAISVSINYSTADTNTLNAISMGFDVEENVSSIVEEKSDKSFQSPQMFGSGKSCQKLPETTVTFTAGEVKMTQAPLAYSSGRDQISEYTNVGSNDQNTPKACSIFGAGEPKSSEVTNIFSTEEPKMPITSYLFGSGEADMPKVSNMFASGESQMPETSKLLASVESKMPDIQRGFNPMESRMPVISPHTESINVITRPNAAAGDKLPVETKINEPNLPDPINFFTESTVAPAENFNRLASYFSSPPKTDHAKSFFELSQSQNHYRHEINNEKYKKLIKDLTSVQNFTLTSDQVIRHVNYFTVEYDTVIPESKGDSKRLFVESDDKCIDYLSNCRYCIDLIYDKSFKVKTAVNDNTETSNPLPMMESVSSTKKQSVTVTFDGATINEEANEEVAEISENRQSSEYTPVKHHWFYRVDVDDKSIWRGFSAVDSRALETTFLSPDLNENTVVATDGGRYDVNIVSRLRIPVYWTDKPTNVRRCSWFYKGTTDPRYVPYTEAVAEKLEVEYQHGISTGEWHRRLLLPNNEVVVMHGPSVMVHFLHSDAFSSPPLFTFGKRVYRNPPKICVSRDQPERIDHLILLVHGAGEYRQQKEKLQSNARPRVVRRGHDDSEIEDAEPSSIDHLLLLCHGVGSACDMRFRSVEEVVEDFRATSLQLVQSHYRQSYDQGIVSRVEVLPISWHSTLHSGETGVDRRLAQITLDSIPRLRSFTNETVLDVLFYTSPVYCQTITNTVCKELNRIYKLFLERNPGFKGGVSLGGHSLGSVILYDLLCHQTPKEPGLERLSSDKSYVSGSAGTGQPTVLYPSLDFQPAALYALGSPIAIFECIRGVESLGCDFSLPTCKNFFNIFHPYDPIAYRIEPLINSRLQELKPYLIPHHKGRKRMHLELKDTMARVGADLKQKLVDSLRSTWNKWKAQPNNGALERVVEDAMDKEPFCDANKEELAKERELELATPEMLGRLNDGRRIDYVLQEAPLEMINEYLFAMSSHVGYWESEDTMLLMLREIYSALGVQPDCTVPQQSMTVQRTTTQETTVVITAGNPSTSSGRH